MVPGGGFEPPFTGPKPVVLPLDDPGAILLITRMRAPSSSKRRACRWVFKNAIPQPTLLKNDSKYPEWFLWFAEHGVRILILLAIGAFALLYVRSRTSTDERLDAIEETVQYEPPRSYVAPKLEEYAAKGVSVASLPVRHTVYVPVYSHIYYDGGRPYLLEATLSVRNTDLKLPLYLSTVHYYDTSGKLSKKYVDELIRLGPLQTIEFLVKRHDISGGSGANFIVEWHAGDTSIEAPFVEAIMVGRSGTNAISFVSPGRTLEGSPSQ